MFTRLDPPYINNPVKRLRAPDRKKTSMQQQTSTTPKLQPAAWVERLTAYAPPKTAAPIDLKLDANEGPAVEPRSANFSMPTNCARYPSKAELEAQIAGIHGVDPCQVLVTCGGDDAIDRVCRAFLQTGRNIVIPEPTFVMIRQYATMAGGDVRSVSWTGEFPVDAICNVVDERTSVIAVVSPNNPTGAIVSADQLRELAARCPHCVLLVDQAYAEFEAPSGEQGDGESLTEVARRELPQAIVVRTFSKAWGLAGLRVGYAIAAPELVDWLRRAGSPYPVSGPSLAMASAALDADPAGQAGYIRQVCHERVALQDLLAKCGAEALPSQANFVFARFPSPTRSASFVSEALAALGISVRSFAALPDALRITCPGEPAAFERLCQALRAVLVPQAVLFDMDGVLVDEAPSYREAIRRTCEAFCQTVTAEEIARAKLAGDANNDWEFTLRLLRDRGVDCSLDEVMDCFEGFYQGDEDNPGLWQRETLLVDRGWLSQLSARYPLAIVTGRPRDDAMRFLNLHQLTDCFSAIVCMQDGPAKPDPANVQRALDQLGVTSAWMLGDTPDDYPRSASGGCRAAGDCRSPGRPWLRDGSTPGGLRRQDSRQPRNARWVPAMTNSLPIRDFRFDRRANVHRETRETRIQVTLCLDGCEKSKCKPAWGSSITC